MFEDLDLNTAALLEDEGNFGQDRIETRRLVAFESGSGSYGIPIGDVVEVHEPLPIASLPIGRVPNYVLGLVSLRGTILPVIDIDVILGYDAIARPESSPLIIVKGTGWQVAWKVQNVLGLLRIPIDAFQDPPASFADTRYCEGVTRWEGRLLVQLNAHEIILGTRMAERQSRQT
jgi:purine-binding chemotaxis protein CheW